MSAITTYAAINSRGAQIGAATFNAALQSMRGGVALTGAAIKGLHSTIFSLRGALAALGGVASGVKIAEAADAFLLLKSRLELVAREGTPATAVLNGVADAAERARAPALELAKIYQRNANALADLGRSQEEGIRLAETLSKVTAISGVSAGEASAAMLQLSQAIVSNRLQGDEFRSVAENLPEVLRILQRETGKTAKELRKLAEEGQLTGELLVNSLLNASQEVDEKFSKVPQTAGAAWTVLMDQMKRTFGVVAENSALSQSLADVLNKIREYISSPEMIGGFQMLVDGVKGAANGFLSLMGQIKEAKIQLDAWHRAITETTLYKTFAAAVETVSGAYKSFVEVREKFFADTALAGGVIDPVAEKAKGYANELRAVTEWQTKVVFGEKAIQAASGGKKLPVKFGIDEDTVRKMKKMIELEDLRNQRSEALLQNDRVRAEALETEIELRQKVTDELRKAPPELVAQLRAQVLLTNELERQKRIQQENQEVGEQFAGTLVDAFKDAGREGRNFGDTLKNVAAKMIEVVVQTAVLEPMIKNLGRAFAGMMGGTSFPQFFENFFGNMMSGMGGGGNVGMGMPGGLYANGAAFDGPIRFSAPGMSRGTMAEAGPEGIFPLKRGANGKLGIEASGAGGGTQINHFHINGDATDATVDKMRRMAREEISRSAPGIVRNSVDQVRRNYVADPNYLRR